MSNYISQNVRLRAQCVNQVASMLHAGLDEAALMARASAVVRGWALLSEDALTGLAGVDAPLGEQDLGRLAALVASLGHRLPDVSAGVDRNAAVVAVAASAYEAVTQDFIVQSVLESISEPGIAFGRPRVRRGEDVVTIDARRGNSALLVRVSRDGNVERDWLVSEDEDCHVLDDALDLALRRRGLEFDVIVEDHHGGRISDARLFGPALRRDADNPARGAVLDAERPLPAPDEQQATPRAAGTTAPVRTRRTVRGRS